MPKLSVSNDLNVSSGDECALLHATACPRPHKPPHSRYRVPPTAPLPGSEELALSFCQLAGQG